VRATSQVRSGSPARPGATAEPSTPIIVARTTRQARIPDAGSAPRNTPSHASARSSIELEFRTKATATQPGAAVTSALRSRRVHAITVATTTTTVTAT
jgi:hypothetical protein